MGKSEREFVSSRIIEVVEKQPSKLAQSFNTRKEARSGSLAQSGSLRDVI